jgi:hypothetical protein
MVEPLFVGLDKLPRHSHTFLWADYVELICLCSQNGMYAKGNLQEQEQEAEDVQCDTEDDFESSSDITSEETDDKIATRWDDIKTKLASRQVSFPGWPFELVGDVLKRKVDYQSPDHRLYVSLLIASSLRLCNLKRTKEITDAFEEISFHWLRQSLTPHWRVNPFGAHQNLPGAYTGTLRAKLEQLAKDIDCRLVKDASDYDPRDTGDAGIDLVAWQMMGDRRGHTQVIFGQCACSPTDWESKQLDVTPSSTEAHIHPQHPGAAYCFLPHDLYENNSRWSRASHVKKTVLIDRRRLLHLFVEQKSSGQLPIWSFLSEAATQAA